MKNLLLSLLGCTLLTACNHNPIAITAQTNNHTHQWYCEANTNKQWRCSNLAYIKTRITTAQPTTETINPPITASLIAKEQHITAETRNHNSLFDYPDHYVAVQLLAAKQQRTIVKFQQQYSYLPTKQFTINNGDISMHILLLGIYANYTEAKTAINAIEPPLRFTPWIRPLAPLKSNMAAY